MSDPSDELLALLEEEVSRLRGLADEALRAVAQQGRRAAELSDAADRIQAVLRRHGRV